MKFISFKNYFATRWKAIILISFFMVVYISMINSRTAYSYLPNFTRKMYEKGIIATEDLVDTSTTGNVKNTPHRNMSTDQADFTFAKGSYVTPAPFLKNATQLLQAENQTNIPGVDSMDKYLQRPVQSTVDDEGTHLTESQRRDFNLLISSNETCKSTRKHAKNSSQTFNEISFDFSHDVFLLMTVKSLCLSRERRQAIRSTWGNESWIYEAVGVRAKLIFLLGDCQSARDKEQVFVESLKYSDILQWDFQDTFKHLTLKECLFLQWYARHCRNVPFLYQGDDDVLVNVENIVHYLFSLPDGDKKSIWTGSVLEGSQRITNPKSKYYVSEKLFSGKEYPPYVSGGGNILSGRLAVRFLIESLRTPMIPIDDAFIGILAKSIGVIPTNDDGFKSWGMDDPSPQNLASIKTYHRVSPTEMVSMWNNMVAV